MEWEWKEKIKVDGIEWMMWVEWAPKHITNNPQPLLQAVSEGAVHNSLHSPIPFNKKEKKTFLFYFIPLIHLWIDGWWNKKVL